MSKEFQTIKDHYDAKRWNIEHVRAVYEKGLITKDEYEIITGEQI